MLHGAMRVPAPMLYLLGSVLVYVNRPWNGHAFITQGIKVCTQALRMVSMTGGGAVRSGGSATLRCTYDLEGAQLYSIKWYRNEDEFYRYVPKESPPALVFSLPGVHVDLSASNDQRVTLTGVHRQLAGVYHCEVSADAPLFHTEIQSTRLEIVDIPETDVILSVDRQRFSPGDSIRANCSSSSSYPAANLTWYLNEEMVMQTHTTTLPLDPDLWETSSSFSIIEITTEEEMQHPKYQVGGTQQEISSSQLRIPSQNPEITVYTAYSSIQPNAHERKMYDTAEGFETPYKYNEVRKEDIVFRDEVKDGTRGLEQGFREYPLRVSAVPLKVTRVRMQPGFGTVLKLRCEATIYDVYKASSEVINIREEQPNSALVMGHSSGSSVTNKAFGVVNHCFLIAGINCLHTVWKVLISGR